MKEASNRFLTFLESVNTASQALFWGNNKPMSNLCSIFQILIPNKGPFRPQAFISGEKRKKTNLASKVDQIYAQTHQKLNFAFRFQNNAFRSFNGFD